MFLILTAQSSCSREIHQLHSPTAALRTPNTFLLCLGVSLSDWPDEVLLPRIAFRPLVRLRRTLLGTGGPQKVQASSRLPHVNLMQHLVVNGIEQRCHCDAGIAAAETQRLRSHEADGIRDRYVGSVHDEVVVCVASAPTTVLDQSVHKRHPAASHSHHGALVMPDQAKGSHPPKRHGDRDVKVQAAEVTSACPQHVGEVGRDPEPHAIVHTHPDEQRRSRAWLQGQSKVVVGQQIFYRCTAIWREDVLIDSNGETS